MFPVILSSNYVLHFFVLAEWYTKFANKIYKLHETCHNLLSS